MKSNPKVKDLPASKVSDKPNLNHTPHLLTLNCMSRFTSNFQKLLFIISVMRNEASPPPKNFWASFTLGYLQLDHASSIESLSPLPLGAQPFIVKSSNLWPA